MRERREGESERESERVVVEQAAGLLASQGLKWVSGLAEVRSGSRGHQECRVADRMGDESAGTSCQGCFALRTERGTCVCEGDV